MQHSGLCREGGRRQPRLHDGEDGAGETEDQDERLEPPEPILLQLRVQVEDGEALPGGSERGGGLGLPVDSLGESIR